MSLDLFNSGPELEPRSASPWDSLLHASLALSARDTGVASGTVLEGNEDDSTRLLKLVPEMEEGNVEYKLKLLDPSPDRFARLVTQLKWRLLEGQGQAYYEIGVADSGLLIGLTKRDLERSLETLEEMAGEIGASVIITKEIEVPGALVWLAEQAVQEGEPKAKVPSFEDVLGEEESFRTGLGLGLGAWDRRSKRAEVLKSVDSLSVVSSSASTTRTTSTSATETEAETSEDMEDPVVKTFQALNFDDFDLLADEDHQACDDDIGDGLFPFDPEPSFSPAASEAPETPSSNQSSTTSLSISSVFKLRPRRQRTAVPMHHKADRRQQKIDARLNYKASKGATAVPEVPKHEKRRHARDRRREVKRQALLSAVQTEEVVSVVESTEGYTIIIDESAVQEDEEVAVDHAGVLSPSANEELVQVLEDVAATTSEPRLIVEVLVVRKLSVGAATYGDFGFSFDFA